MRVIIDEIAYDDLDRVYTWIAKDQLGVADRVINQIFGSIETLARFPFMGHEGRAPKTYEWIVEGLPYIVVYEMNSEHDEFVVIAVFHGAQDR